MVFVIHRYESAMNIHVFPIPIPPPTSLSTRSLWVFPVPQPEHLSHASSLGWWSVLLVLSKTYHKECSVQCFVEQNLPVSFQIGKDRPNASLVMEPWRLWSSSTCSSKCQTPGMMRGRWSKKRWTVQNHRGRLELMRNQPLAEMSTGSQRCLESFGDIFRSEI